MKLNSANINVLASNSQVECNHLSGIDILAVAINGGMIFNNFSLEVNWQESTNQNNLD